MAEINTQQQAILALATNLERVWATFDNIHKALSAISAANEKRSEVLISLQERVARLEGKAARAERATNYGPR